jgi:hypothetical protein
VSNTTDLLKFGSSINGSDTNKWAVEGELVFSININLSTNFQFCYGFKP